MNQLRRLAHIVSIHSILVSLPRASYFLDCMCKQKEVSRYTSLCKLDELNQPTSINRGPITYLA